MARVLGQSLAIAPVTPILHRPLPPVLATGPPMTWTREAEQRLKEIPFFVRPAVRRRIETLATEAGLATIDEAFYEQAKARFGEK